MATGRLHRRQVPTARRLSRIIKRASETTELQPLEPHPFAQLFPAISEEKVTELSRDIALHGQFEPIVLYQGPSRTCTRKRCRAVAVSWARSANFFMPWHSARKAAQNSLRG